MHMHMHMRARAKARMRGEWRIRVEGLHLMGWCGGAYPTQGAQHKTAIAAHMSPPSCVDANRTEQCSRLCAAGSSRTCEDTDEDGEGWRVQ